jgi:hypothetical protein
VGPGRQPQRRGERSDGGRGLAWAARPLGCIAREKRAAATTAAGLEGWPAELERGRGKGLRFGN